MTGKTTLEIFTGKSKLVADRQQTVDVLLRITPPQVEKTEAKRPKLNLSIVLDRSGSMEGNKMLRARDAAKYCIDNLLSTDRLSTVIFDDIVEVLFASRLVENKQLLKRQIDSISARNSTALHEAWVRGGLEVSKELDGAAINRVLLITDGLANVGETNTDRIVSQAQQLAAKGVSTSTIGIGSDFNEDLLMPMAEAGNGNAWHVEKAEDMTRIFAVELEGLVGQVGHTVTLGVKPAASSGVTIVDCLNDFERDDSGRYKLPNLEVGSPLDIVVQLRVPAQEVGAKLSLAEIGLTYIEQSSHLPETVKKQFEIDFAPAAEVESLPENLEVAKAVLLLMNARARQEAINKMDELDYAAAGQALNMARASTQVLFSMAPSAAMAEEISDLSDLEDALKDRGQDKMNRKRMAYGAYDKRRGK